MHWSDQKGLTLMEIVVAMVLLVAVGAASLYSFSSTAQATKGDSNIAANILRGNLEQIYERVRQDEWADANRELSLATGRPVFPNKTLNNMTFQTVYEVNDDTTSAINQNPDAQEDYRKVTMTVCWDQVSCP